MLQWRKIRILFWIEIKTFNRIENNILIFMSKKERNRSSNLFELLKIWKFSFMRQKTTTLFIKCIFEWIFSFNFFCKNWKFWRKGNFLMKQFFKKLKSSENLTILEFIDYYEFIYWLLYKLEKFLWILLKLWICDSKN